MLWLISVCLLIAGVRSDNCTCQLSSQPPNNYDENNWPAFYIQNPMLSNGNACTTSCKYVMDSGDDSKGIGNYWCYTWDNDGGVNYLSIYNSDVKGTVLGAPLLSNATYTTPLSTFQSTSRYVVVLLTVTKPVNILCTMNRTSISAAPMSTTARPATTTYLGPFNKSPSLISNDVLFMVDGGANGGRDQAFNESKYLAAAIVDAFDPNAVFAMNATQAPSYGSRMTLRYLTNTNNLNIGTPWNESPSFISSQVKNVFQIQTSPTNYKTALDLLLNQKNSPFMINNPDPFAYQNSRDTAQRLVIIVATSVPSDFNTINGMDDSFVNLDVHPIFVAYSMSDADVATVKTALSPFWGVFSVSSLNDLSTTVKNFVNGYLLDATNVCSVDTTVTAPTATANSKVYPANYKSALDSWDENHQTGRYCNFQTFSLKFPDWGGPDEENVFQNSDNSKVLKFTVTYELEPGKDFLIFSQDDGTEIASLSGADVGSSTFYAKGNVTAQFTSNENQVFGGFNITYQLIPLAP